MQAAYEWVEGRGFSTPRRVRTRSAGEALEAGKQFDGRFVVKQPNRHSAMGIYVLEELQTGRYFELFTLTEMGADDVRPNGPAPDYWLTEELLASTIAGRPVPLDYKIFCFRGLITHVIQIDRNVSPPRVAVFDGAFIPLVPGKDYTTNTERWDLCQPVLPIHAGRMLHMASRLSERLQTAFVRVDCFDTPDGPVFGEFTFASGPDDVGMIRYSDRILSASSSPSRAAREPRRPIG